jgi:hypothetical protein
MVVPLLIFLLAIIIIYPPAACSVNEALTNETCQEFLFVFPEGAVGVEYEIGPSTNITLYENQGTWKCGSFACNNQSCNYGIAHPGLLNSCCTLYNLKYFDFWFTPQDSPQDEDGDAHVEIYDYDIYINETAITVENTTFTGVPNTIGKKTFFSVIMDGYCDGDCIADFHLFINATLALTLTTNRLSLFNIDGELRFPFVIRPRPNGQRIWSLYIHTEVPTEEEIEQFFLQGPNRNASSAICTNKTEECVEESTCPTTTNGYKIATIVLAALLVLCIILMVIFLIWFLLRYYSPLFGKPVETFRALMSREDVVMRSKLITGPEMGDWF